MANFVMCSIDEYLPTGHSNDPMNLDLIVRVCKSNGSHSDPKIGEYYSIQFDAVKYTYHWRYSTKKDRDEDYIRLLTIACLKN